MSRNLTVLSFLFDFTSGVESDGHEFSKNLSTDNISSRIESCKIKNPASTSSYTEPCLNLPKEMSNFKCKIRIKRTGEVKEVYAHDDYFGRHQYGYVDGEKVYREDEIDIIQGNSG